MIYRFLNTIIDDLFSFIITMPTMHRISCFRDDLIFVIYLYQRYKYRIDKTRGMYATEKKVTPIEQAPAGEGTTEQKEIQEASSNHPEASVETKKDQ